MQLKAGKPRKKKCANQECRAEFQPERSFQSWCSSDCAIVIARAKQARASDRKAKAERAEHRAAKEKVKRRSDWLREAQVIVNRYVRLRDAHLGCVSCDKGAEWDGQWHASHLRSVGSASAIRYNLWNIHKSCSQCNLWLSANLSEYLPRVRAKIGDDKVDWLYQQNEPEKFSIEYLKRLKRVIGRKVRKLEKRQGVGEWTGM